MPRSLLYHREGPGMAVSNKYCRSAGKVSQYLLLVSWFSGD